MSFFGFENNNLEQERQNFMQGGLDAGSSQNVAEFTWGEDSYDNLAQGDNSAEDDLNDVTFAGGEIGMRFPSHTVPRV